MGSQERVDSPGQEVVLSASQEQQVNEAIGEQLKGKVEGLNRLKEGIQVLHVEIEDKGMRKDELIKLYDEKKTETEYRGTR